MPYYADDLDLCSRSFPPWLNPCRQVGLYTMVLSCFCSFVPLLVCSSVANMYWWWRGLIMLTIQATLACYNRQTLDIREPCYNTVTIIVTRRNELLIISLWSVVALWFVGRSEVEWRHWSRRSSVGRSSTRCSQAVNNVWSDSAICTEWHRKKWTVMLLCEHQLRCSTLLNRTLMPEIGPETIKKIKILCSICSCSVLLSASLYVSKRGAYWDRPCRDVVGRWLSRACTVAKRCILGL